RITARLSHRAPVRAPLRGVWRRHGAQLDHPRPARALLVEATACAPDVRAGDPRRREEPRAAVRARALIFRCRSGGDGRPRARRLYSREVSVSLRPLVRSWACFALLVSCGAPERPAKAVNPLAGLEDCPQPHEVAL